MAWSVPRTWVTGEVVTASIMNTHIRDQLLALAPTGMLMHLVAGSTSAETVVQGGWLECNGVNVSRSTYATLFTYLNGLSLPFGVGDGSTTFGLPNFKGRVPVGDHTSGTFATLGGTGGAETHTLITGEIPSHAHGPSWAGNFIGSGIDGVGTGTAYNWGEAGVTGNTGGGGSHNNIQPYIVAGIWAIKF